MKRVLVVGGSGQLGTAIAARWHDFEIVAPPHDELPIEQTPLLEEALDRIAPEVLFNAAAFHDVDRCEAEPQRAFEINARAPGDAARLAAARGIVFMTISTDYVFDGKKSEPYSESDRPNPLSAYGASRLAGERLVEAAGGRAFVVRTCGLYGASRSPEHRPTFIERIVGQARAGEPVRVVADVIASPTYSNDLADALRVLAAAEAYGLYHAAGAGAVSWFDFAREALAQARVGLPIEPISAGQWKTAAIRPRFSALDNAKLRERGISLRPWRAGLAEYLGALPQIGVR
ncbi:MAG TPA: dTDP-4-dehydrorhamnose reductase [Candidatus Cybelea sp.]